MATPVTPRGLICSLALVPNPENPSVYQGLESLIARLQPAVAGLFLDPMFWCPSANCCGPASSSLLEEAIGLAPPDLPLWVRITGSSAEQTIHICHQLENVWVPWPGLTHRFSTIVIAACPNITEVSSEIWNST